MNNIQGFKKRDTSSLKHFVISEIFLVQLLLINSQLI